eukprot:scaffold1131_cov161-Amphora_coffeaeformis.AAC.9
MPSLIRPRHCCTSLGALMFRYLFVLLGCRFRMTTNAWQPSSPARRQFLSTGTSRLYSSFSNENANEDPGSDPVLRLPLMEAELATKSPSRTDDPEAYTALQDAIADAKTAAEFGVRAAQLLFYDAFSEGDLDAMDRVWSTDLHVRCVHPGMRSIEGRDAVMSSWKQILASPKGSIKSPDNEFRITPVRTQVEICGLVAICSCVEKTNPGGGELEALNIYKRENGAWKMTLHMAGPILIA